MIFFVIILRYIDFCSNRYDYKVDTIFLMQNSTYLYSFILLFIFSSLIYFFYNFRHVNEELNNKVLLKNLLEGLDMELPDELKALDTSSTDPHEL